MLRILGVVLSFTSWFAYSHTHLLLTGLLLQSGLEDLRALAPVLSVFGLPVSTSVDVGAFSCGIICPLLKPQRLVTLNVLS